MALTNTRPLQLLSNMENDILHNTTSPIFQFNMNGNNINAAQDDSINNTTDNTLADNSNNNGSGSQINNHILNGGGSLPGSDVVDISDINPSLENNNDISFDNNQNITGTNTGGSTGNTNTSSIVSNNSNANLANLNVTPVNNIPTNNGNANNDQNGGLVTPNTSQNGNKPLKQHKVKSNNSNNSLNNPMIEISKLLPVTGERPRPSDKSGPLDDNVLFAVFIILFEMDPNQNGMTVKQLCDHLLIRHPEMSNLSTKLSNLISAKLNAYVKKIEKGEKTLKYSLSREWSNSSPRRMLYIYRGILSPDYKEKAQLVASQLKKQMSQNNLNDFKNNGNGNFVQNGNFSSSGLNGSFNGSNSNSAFAKSFNTTSNFNDKTISNLNFTLTPEFNIPYASSPVSVTLNNSISNDSTFNNIQNFSNTNNNNNNNNGINNNSNNILKNNDNNNSNDLNNNKVNNHDSMKPPTKLNNKRKSNNDLENNNNNNNSNSRHNSLDNSNNGDSLQLPSPKKIKSVSSLGDSNNNTNNNNSSSSSISMSQSSFNIGSNNNNNNSGSNNSYVTAVRAVPRISKLLPRSNFNGSNSSVNVHNLIISQSPVQISKSDSDDDDQNWIKIVRNGFLTKDIEKPESISIDDLDNMF